MCGPHTELDLVGTGVELRVETTDGVEHVAVEPDAGADREVMAEERRQCIGLRHVERARRGGTIGSGHQRTTDHVEAFEPGEHLSYPRRIDLVVGVAAHDAIHPRGTDPPVRARFSPAVGSSTTRNHGMRSVHSAATTTVPSVEPLSTTTSSQADREVLARARGELPSDRARSVAYAQHHAHVRNVGGSGSGLHPATVPQ